MSLVETPFKLTLKEILCSAAATLCLIKLTKLGVLEKSIAELCFTPQYGFTASASMEPCGPRFVRISDIREGTINWNEVPFCDSPNSRGYELKSDDILIARAGASIGKSFLVMHVPETAVFASYMIRLCTKPDIAPSYIYWCCQSQQFWQQVTEAQRGSAMKNINGKMLASLRFPIPSREIQDAVADFLSRFKAQVGKKESGQPLPSLPSLLYEEQQLIARIEGLAGRIEEARGLRREAVEGSKRLIALAVTQILKAVASEAKQVTVESISCSVTDGDHQPPPKADSGIPFIFINHIVRGNIDLSSCKWVPPEYFTSLPANRIPKRGDVLYTAVGSYGVPCLVDIDEPFCFQRHIAIIKPNQNLIVPAYLKWALSSSDVFDQATKVATGSAQLTVPLRGIRNLQFPLPSLDEQQRIVTYLDSLRSKLDSLKQLQSETSAELDALLPSILDKAFKGDL